MYKQKVILFFSCIAIVFSFFIVCFFFFIKFPLYTPAGYWMRDTITVKEHYCHTITKPKIFIISGSNSFVGICTPLLKEKTNMEVVNFGLFFQLPLKIFFKFIKDNTKPNDIVLMPLEYSYYTNQEKFIKWKIDNLTTWGTDLLFELNPMEILEIFLHAIPGYYSRLKNFRFNLPIHSYDEYIKDKNLTAILTNKSYNTHNVWGDALEDKPPVLIKDNVKYDYFKEKQLKNFCFQQLKDFSEFLAKQNIKLVLTYPVSIQNPNFNLTKKEHLIKIETLNKKFQKYDLKYIGMPELSNFEFKFSFDSSYHLNAEGAILHTLYFADMINCYLAGKPQEIANLEEYKNEKKAEAGKILEEYRKLGYVSE